MIYESYNLHKNYFKGLRFNVYMDGSVFTKKNEEIGYINKNLLAKVDKEQMKGLLLDKIVKKNIIIPSTIQVKINVYFKNIKQKIKPLKKFKKLPWITLRKATKYKDILTDLEYEILKRSYKGQNSKTIAHQLGIKYTTVNTYRHLAKKKICKL